MHAFAILYNDAVTEIKQFFTITITTTTTTTTATTTTTTTTTATATATTTTITTTTTTTTTTTESQIFNTLLRCGGCTLSRILIEYGISPL